MGWARGGRRKLKLEGGFWPVLCEVERGGHQRGREAV